MSEIKKNMWARALWQASKVLLVSHERPFPINRSIAKLKHLKDYKTLAHAFKFQTSHKAFRGLHLHVILLLLLIKWDKHSKQSWCHSLRSVNIDQYLTTLLVYRFFDISVLSKAWKILGQSLQSHKVCSMRGL